MNESCVETTAAPEWLSKLESRREKLTKRRLGHESGAGAPCNVCGTKCPGLDLHFWRKVCRNCKCRKELHECQDDDLSGWAQFEILGQIRSKPAYINITHFADKPVKLDWIPPNVETDLVTDYMTQLGTKHIPIAGSDAAAKRKQQLEFQVPPHDLDPTLCDNLTEKEEEQLQQYVDKIKENCVGQGNIVRINESQISIQPPVEYQQTTPVMHTDKLAIFILNSETVKGLLQKPSTLIEGSVFKQSVAKPLVPDFHASPILSDKNKFKLNSMKINSQAVQSGTINGPFYDQLLTNLKDKRINYDDDFILKPMDDFRKEYLHNDKFQSDIDKYVNSLGNRFLDTIPELAEEEAYATPVKKSDNYAWKSPLPFKHPISLKQGQIVQQETPMRKVNFTTRRKLNPCNIQDLYNPQTGLPLVPTIKNDRIVSTVLNSDVVQGILQDPAKIIPGTKLIICRSQILPDYSKSSILSEKSKNKLDEMNINSQGIQSGVVHGSVYDKIFPDLKTHKINYCNDTILNPIETFRNEFNNNEPFRNEVQQYVENMGTEMIDRIPIETPFSSPIKSHINPSASNDSGFESIPPTPSYSKYPEFGTSESVQALQGKIAAIPGITDMNMYPHVQPGVNKDFVSNQKTPIEKGMENLNLVKHEDTVAALKTIVPCQQCKKDISAGEVAVKAERAGKDVAWHPQCFVCHKCNELLADLVYFFHGGQVYCARDLAVILKIPRCHACDELIFTKAYTAAEGATFHIKHFCCYQCDSPLAGQQYLPDEKTNMPLCLKCYEEYHAEICQLCKKGIGPLEQGVAWGKIHWHSNCFICLGVDCGKSLIGGRLCVKNDTPFCSPQCVRSITQ